MATTQNFVYPSSSDVTITGIGTPNGQPIPADSVLVAGENPSGNQQVLQTDSSGNLLVSLAAEPVNPFSVNIADYGGTATTLGQKVSASSIPVVIASDDTVAISASALPLPTGAATSANQTNASQKTQIVDGSGNVIASTSNALNVQVENFPATQPVSGTVAVTQSTSPWVVGQSTASSLNATVVQGTAANLLTQVSQPTAASLNATVVQGTAANLNATVAQGTASNLKTQSFAGTPTALTVTQAAISVGTSAVRLTVSGSAPASDRVVLVATPDTATATTVTFYIGSSTVTNSGSTRGIEITVGQSFIANNDAGDYWIVASTTSQTVTVMEQS